MNYTLFEKEALNRMKTALIAVTFFYPVWYWPCVQFFNGKEDLLGRSLVSVCAILFLTALLKLKNLSFKKIENFFTAFVIFYTIHLIWLSNLNQWSYIYILGCMMHFIAVFPQITKLRHIFILSTATLLANLLFGYVYAVPLSVLFTVEAAMMLIITGILILFFQNKNLKNQLLQSLDELALAEKLRFESEKMAVLGTMTGGVAHEINNPLSIILGKTNLVARLVQKADADRQKISDALKKTTDTLSRIGKIIEGLIVCSQKKSDLNVTTVDFRKVIDQALFSFQSSVSNHNISIQVECESPLWIQLDPQQFESTLKHLISNSIDAIKEKDEKWIRITVSKKQERLFFKIVDSGDKIKSEIVDKIMLPFFTAKDIGQGTGLGLSMAKAVVEVHGGQLDYLRDEAHTTFQLTVPMDTQDLKTMQEIAA